MSESPSLGTNPSKRSRGISLWLLGSACVLSGGCEHLDYMQHVYANKVDCASEWSEEECYAESSPGLLYYWGLPQPDWTPMYYGPRVSVLSPRIPVHSRAVTVHRGGFGGSARSSGGSARYGYGYGGLGG